MFRSHLWDPRPQLPHLGTFSYSSHQNHASPNPADHRQQGHRLPQRRHHHHHHRPLVAIEDAGFSESEQSESSSSTSQGNTSMRLSHSLARLGSEARSTPLIKQVGFKMPAQRADALGMHRDEILILPVGLPTRLKIQIRFHHATETLRVAVATDMLLRDVVKQLLPEQSPGETSVYVRLRGEWRQSATGLKVSELVDMGASGTDGLREIEVRIRVHGRNLSGYGERRVSVRDRGRETEMDTEERFWMFG